MNDQIRAQLDAARQQQIDKYAQAIHYTGEGVMNMPYDKSFKAAPNPYIEGPTHVQDFVASVRREQALRAYQILNVPAEMDSYHRLAFSRQISPKNESASHRGIYGF